MKHVSQSKQLRNRGETAKGRNRALDVQSLELSIVFSSCATFLHTELRLNCSMQRLQVLSTSIILVEID